MERPLFISDYPFDQGLDMMDCYFNLDTNQWNKFDLDKNITRMQINFNEQIPSMRIVQNLMVPTYDTIRYNYLMELLLTTQKPVLVFGAGACGKSALVKDTLFAQMLVYARNYFVEHVTCSHHTKVFAIKGSVERNLEVKKREVSENRDELGKTMNSVQMEVAADSGHLKPPGDRHKLIVYLEDLHLTWIDKYQDTPGAEVLRDLLTTREWYSTQRKSHRVIEDTNVIACVDASSEHYERVPSRFLFQFALVGMGEFSADTSIHIMKTMFEI